VSYIASSSATCCELISVWISSGLTCTAMKLATSGIANNSSEAHITPDSARTSRGMSARMNSKARRQRGSGGRYITAWPRCIRSCRRATSCGL